MQKKLWVRLFWRMAAVFAGFVLLLVLCNTTLLEHYFVYCEKAALRQTAGEILQLNWSDPQSLSEQLIAIEEEKQCTLKVSTTAGQVLYTSVRGGMFGAAASPDSELLPPNLREPSESNRLPEKPMPPEEYISHTATRDGLQVELQVRRAYLTRSAEISARFIFILACIALVAALIWTVFFARAFTKPIRQMNDITRRMAQLDFSQRLTPDSKDEIGQLAQSVNTLSGALDTALQDLQSKNADLQKEIDAERRLDAMRRGFVANVSHELKTPIAIIQGYAEGLKSDVGRQQADRYCDVLIEESRRMQGIVTGLLNLSKLESGQAAFCPEAVDIAATLRHQAKELTAKAQRPVTLRDELPETLLLQADAGCIGFVTGNYLSNAFSHVATGGQIALRAVPQADGLCRIEVENTGEPIAKEAMELIWQSFYRGDTSHKREADRFGLGLSIVRAVMALHRQPCGVYNTSSGVCFWFTLPYTER